MNVMFTIFPIFFFLIFGLVLTIFFYVLVTNIAQTSKNNHSPRLTVHATVVGKRDRHTHHRNGGHSTSYYVTFQVESGDRMELCVMGQEYGLLCEGDRGQLTFQGTRYLSFEREF